MRVSIVCAAYNEEENIPFLHKEITAMTIANHLDYEWIVVDDGSSDRTADVLQEIAASDPHTVPVILPQNCGQSFAMLEGIRAAQAEIIVLLDADLQNDPADIPRLLDKLEEGYDLVCGWRKDRKDNPLTSNLPSRAGNWLIRTLFGIAIHDTGCSLKVCRKNAIEDLPYFRNVHRYIPVILSRKGARIGESEVNHRPRTMGESKYSVLKIFGVVRELIYLRFFFKG